MGIVIDRRSEPSKSRISRERLIQRTRGAAREAINRSISEGSITNIGKNGTDVTIPKGGLSEPHFVNGKGGIIHRVLPGNDNEKARFRVGDRVPRPEKEGGGSAPSADGSGQDDFIYHLSEEEFLTILFEDLELPNLFKLGAEDTEKTVVEQAGFSHTGAFNRLDLVRSKMEKNKRRNIMNRRTNEEIIVRLEEVKGILSAYGDSLTDWAESLASALSIQVKVRVLNGEVKELRNLFGCLVTIEERNRIAQLDKELLSLFEKKRFVGQWHDGMDLRYRAVEENPLPTSKAVMFCEMDVSGSMDEGMKKNAKLFFFLLNRFLRRQYDHVDVIFIRHHSVASEVDEKTFFESPETGGTVVSTAHELLLQIQKERYPESEWNIYVAQASDGDNITYDNDRTLSLLRDNILPFTQGFFYVEVLGMYSVDFPTEIWSTYETLVETHKDHFWMRRVRERKDIFPVFHDLFKKSA